MNQKKTNKKKKNKDNLQKNLPKIFLIILTITLIASISSYMFLSDKKEEPIKVEETHKKTNENESSIIDEQKTFDEKKTEQDLEQPIKDDLHNKFEEILQSNNVYFQSPPDVLMKYPAIRYSIDDIDISHADGINYKQFNKYSVIIIDRNPDSKICDKILDSFEYASFVRFYPAENLNHWVLYIYW